MRQYILTIIMSLILTSASVFASGTGNLPQAKEKSEVEKFMHNLARIKSKQINYAYISTSMFRQMFNLFANDAELKDIQNLLASIQNMRRFVTTGATGYDLLSKAIQPFTQIEESVMGMKLMALNRENGNLSIIYSNSDSVLVINDDENNELTIVFIVGLTYELFKIMNEEGLDFNLNF